MASVIFEEAMEGMGAPTLTNRSSGQTPFTEITERFHGTTTDTSRTKIEVTTVETAIEGIA